MTQLPFFVEVPKTLQSGVVFASPHSGRAYSQSFLQASVLDEKVIRSSEDAFVDQIFGQAVDFGASFLAAKAPRAYVDLNRACEELDPALIMGARKPGHNPRVMSGLGVIPRVVANGKAIYRGKMTREVAQQRLDAYWHPYHHKLQELLDQAQMGFGQTVLLDCHSMPHEAVNPGNSSMRAPHIVLGDRFGAASKGIIVDQIEMAFQRSGFRVARNSPFAGAYTAQHYGRPSRNQHVVQVEIDRSLYMDEATITPLRNFPQFCQRMRLVIADIARIVTKETRLAAE